MLFYGNAYDGQPRRMLLGRWQIGAEAAFGGCCVGGGRLVQRQHKSIGMQLFDQDQPEHNPAAAHCCNPSHKFVGCEFVFENLFEEQKMFKSCANKSPNLPQFCSKCEI